MKSNKRIKSFVIWVIIITIILAMILFLLISPIFSIVEINVEDNHNLSKEDIIQLSRNKYRR